MTGGIDPAKVALSATSSEAMLPLMARWMDGSRLSMPEELLDAAELNLLMRCGPMPKTPPARV